jgi:putative hydrolase of HD superfamily
MVLQAKIYQKEGQSKEKLESFFESAKNKITDPKLKELFTKIMEDTQ